MRRTHLGPPVALSLWLLIVLGAAPAAGQGPATAPANSAPSSPGPRPAEGNRATLGPPEPVAEPGTPPPPALAPGEASPAAPGTPAADQALPGPRPDAFAPAAGGFAPFFNPVVGQAPFRADYRATWFPSEPVSAQPANLGYWRQDFAVSFPLWQAAGCDEWSGFVNVRTELFQTQAVLPDTRQPFPDELWDVRFGATYRHLFDNGWIAGGTVSVGSASDKPFHGIDEMTAGVHAFLRVPSGEHNAWLFTLSYSTTSDLPVPLPGVAFLWQPSENFRANLGLPFQVWWRPAEEVTLDFSYMLLTNVRARAGYHPCRLLCLYAQYAWENESYLTVERVSSNDRFFYFDQRVAAGVQFFVSPHASLDLSTGYVFDRFYFEGRNITHGTDFNRIDVGAGPFVSLQGQLRW
jgi:hypothetical protein